MTRPLVEIRLYDPEADDDDTVTLHKAGYWLTPIKSKDIARRLMDIAKVFDKNTEESR
jgi:hypothetical protein